MTPQTKKLLDFMADYERRRDMPPTFEEMMAHMGLRSKSGVHRMLRQLERELRVIHTGNGHARAWCTAENFQLPTLPAGAIYYARTTEGWYTIAGCQWVRCRQPIRFYV